MATGWEDERVQARNGGNRPSASIARKKTAVDVLIRDDWDDDDDDEDEDGDDPAEREALNKKIWEQANARESRPMPSVIIMSRGSTTSNASSSLPLNQAPAMRILKRPSQSSSPLPNPNNAGGDTIRDREARYLAARERIFGSSSSSTTENDGDAHATHRKQKSPHQSSRSFSPSLVSLPATPYGLASSDAPADAPRNKGWKKKA